MRQKNVLWSLGPKDVLIFSCVYMTAVYGHGFWEGASRYVKYLAKQYNLQPKVQEAQVYIFVLKYKWSLQCNTVHYGKTWFALDNSILKSSELLLIT